MYLVNCHRNSSGKISKASGNLALGSLALGAVTSETGVGPVTFGGLAAGLGAVSAVSGGVSALASYFNGDSRTAVSVGAGAAVGLIGPLAFGRAISATTGADKLVAGVGGDLYGRMASSIVCQVR